jgi:hypothetical protein
VRIQLRRALGFPENRPPTTGTRGNEDCAAGYAAYVLEQGNRQAELRDPVVLIEQRVDSPAGWKGIRTAGLHHYRGRHPAVIDYKHVSVFGNAEEKSEMQCYALGALELFDGIYTSKRSAMTITTARQRQHWKSPKTPCITGPTRC